MSAQPLPAPLPPETRTVGQLVAETIKLYQRRFWPSLATGVPTALLGVFTTETSGAVRLALTPVLGGLLLSASYAGASVIVGGPAPVGRWLRAIAAGFAVFLPFPFLLLAFVVPGLAWLALVGLVVPVIMIERRGVPESFARAVALGRADFVHALGSIGTLAVVVLLTQTMLGLLVHGYSQQAVRVSVAVASIVVSPLLFLGAALLYGDQAARVGRRRG